MQCDSATTYCGENQMYTLVECYNVVGKTHYSPLAVWLQTWTPLPRQTRSSGCCMTARDVVTIRICLWFFVNSLLRFISYTYINWTGSTVIWLWSPEKFSHLGMTFATFLEGKIYIHHSYISTVVIRVEARITDRLRDYKPDLEKYNLAVHFFSCVGR